MSLGLYHVVRLGSVGPGSYHEKKKGNKKQGHAINIKNIYIYGHYTDTC